MLFMLLNTVWIVLTAVALGLIFSGVLGETTRVNWKHSSLHQSFFYSYLAIALTAETAVLIITCKLQRTIPKDTDMVCVPVKK